MIPSSTQVTNSVAGAAGTTVYTKQSKRRQGPAAAHIQECLCVAKLFGNRPNAQLIFLHFSANIYFTQILQNFRKKKERFIGDLR